MLHVGKIPREFEKRLSRCILDVTTLMLYSAAAYDIMSTGPKGKQLPFCHFFEEMEHYFETLQLEDSPSL